MDILTEKCDIFIHFLFNQQHGSHLEVDNDTYIQKSMCNMHKYWRIWSMLIPQKLDYSSSHQCECKTNKKVTKSGKKI